MPDYKSMYFQLAARTADATEILMKAQQQGEDSYIENEDTPVIELVDENRER